MALHSEQRLSEAPSLPAVNAHCSLLLFISEEEGRKDGLCLSICMAFQSSHLVLSHAHTRTRAHTYLSPIAEHNMLLHAYSCMSHFNRHHCQHPISIKHLSSCYTKEQSSILQVNHRSANRTTATVALAWHHLFEVHLLVWWQLCVHSLRLL